MGNKSVTQFYQAPVRFLKELTAKESEFEKPYVDENYRKMHFDFPWPDWPSPDLPPLPPFDGPVPGLPGCAIVCYPPGGGDCDEPIWCHPSIWCGTDPMCNLCSWVVEGATTGQTPHPFGGSQNKSWGIDVWIDSELVEEDGNALINICMTDPCGNLCCSEQSVNCQVCPPETSISWASNVNLTIGQGNGGFATAEVAVADGLGPYQWSVVGTGFSMLHAETLGLINTLQADDTACGVATITVTDFCEESTSGEVRCTAASQWVTKEVDFACPSPWNLLCNQSACATCDSDTLYLEYGKKRWVVFLARESHNDDPGCPPVWAKGFPCDGTACVYPPPCGAPDACGGGIPCFEDRTCSAFQSVYQEWECI